MPHLSGLIGDSPVGEGTWALLEKSCESLEETLLVAKEAGRDEGWKGIVGAAVGRCWVKVGETERGEERERLEERLRRVLSALGSVDEVFERLVKVDKLFEGLRAGARLQ